MHAALTDTDIADRIRTGMRCDLCREPRRPGGSLCWEHHDGLSRVLDPDYLGDRDLDRAASIPNLWARLDPTPTTTGLADRRAPGFASTPPCNIHILAMRDPRSRSYPVVDAWYEPRLPGISSTPNLDQPHYEDTSPPRAVEKAISGLTAAIWDDIGAFGPQTFTDQRTTQGVDDQCGWLHDHLHHQRKAAS